MMAMLAAVLYMSFTVLLLPAWPAGEPVLIGMWQAANIMHDILQDPARILWRKVLPSGNPPEPFNFVWRLPVR